MNQQNLTELNAISTLLTELALELTSNLPDPYKVKRAKEITSALSIKLTNIINENI